MRIGGLMKVDTRIVRISVHRAVSINDALLHRVLISEKVLVLQMVCDFCRTKIRW